MTLPIRNETISHSPPREVRPTIRQRDYSRRSNWQPSGGRVDPVAAVAQAPTRPIAAIQSLAIAMEAKDSYTRGHSLRVSGYAAAMASNMRFTHAEAEKLRLAAELHDIGKLAVREDLLHKDGALTELEYQEVMSHTTVGERILAPLFVDDSTVLSVVRWHHERFDGTGSPDGLAGDTIPLTARIVAVADSFDAMTSARPYRSPLPVSAALKELETHSGSQFDSACVRAFEEILLGAGAVETSEAVAA
ncbi:MAG: HD-GYP domain-containing protein [Gemmatimonadales bacterium]